MSSQVIVWFKVVHSTKHFITKMGFQVSKANSSLLIRKNKTTTIYILIYVDDIIVTGSDSNTINGIISQLNSAFAIKDSGNIHYFLGIEIIQRADGLFLSQHKYITVFSIVQN